MGNCPNCDNKLSKFKIGILYWYNGKRFCSIRCKDEYASKHKPEIKKFSQLSTATQTATIGAGFGGMMVMIGCFLLLVGFLFSITLIGAIIGIPLALLGLILLFFGGVFTSTGLIGALIIKIIKSFEKKKVNKK